MLRASFFTSVKALASFAALLSVTALAGCNHGAGGPCNYTPVGTATFTVTTIAPMSLSTASGQPCSSVSFTWASGATSYEEPVPFPLFATEACLAAAGVQVGSSVEWTLENETSGTCDYQGWFVTDPALGACDSACT